MDVVDGTVVRADELVDDGETEVHIGGPFGWLPLVNVTTMQSGYRRLRISFMQHVVRDEDPIRMRRPAANDGGQP